MEIVRARKHLAGLAFITTLGGCASVAPEDPSASTGKATSAMQDDKCKPYDDDGTDKKHECPPPIPPISCQTKIADYFTGEVLQTIEEPDVPARWGATPNQLVLESEGYKQAFYGAYLQLITAFPSQDPAHYAVTLPYGGGLPGPSTVVHVYVSGGEATMTPFSHVARPFMTRLVTFGCAAGATTILAATP